MKDILAVIDQALQSRGKSAWRASVEATGNSGLIRMMRRGHVPSVDRLRALCEVLGLEFYVGPPRGEAGGDLRKSLSESKDALERLLEQTRDDNDHLRVPFADGVRLEGERVVLEATTGLGISIPPEELHGWPISDGLVCVQVSGDSMRPTLNDGDLVVVDCSSTEPEDSEIFMVHTANGLSANRLHFHDPVWVLGGDSPEIATRPLGSGEQIVGRIVWAAQIYSMKKSRPDHATAQSRVFANTRSRVEFPAISLWHSATRAQQKRAQQRLEAVTQSNQLADSGRPRSAADSEAGFHTGASAKSVARWRRRVGHLPPDAVLEALLDAPGRGRPSQWTLPGAEELWEEWCRHIGDGPPIPIEAWKKTEPIAVDRGWRMPSVAAFERRAKKEDFPLEDRFALAFRHATFRRLNPGTFRSRPSAPASGSADERSDEPSADGAAE